jgi:monoamine oxidase
MGALVDALRRQLASPSLFSGQRVRHLRHSELGVELETEDAQGRVACHRVAHVLLAVPPRLAATAIAFTPALPDALLRDWQNTGTWMAPHAKYVAIYDAPFWREHGLSGEARSAVGPLFEIHDASDPHGGAALFGFFGIPAEARRQVSEDILRAQCRAQLERFFGPEAAAPKAEFVKDWARAAFTATAADMHAAAGHSHAPSPVAASGEWRDRIIGIASEWSPEFPGYVAGAIDAAHRGVARLALHVRDEASRKQAEESH